VGSIYVHVPFCVSKCSYCDFVSSPLADAGGLVPLYLNAVRLELEQAAPRISAISPITSVFVGGGTPTCLPAQELELLVGALVQASAASSPSAGLEFTVEANPATVSRDDLAGLRRAGANRLSIGVQSLDPGELAALGRAHTGAQALEAMEDARAAGFDNISVDLILGAPEQTRESLKRTLGRLLAGERPPEHVSAYCLQLETGTPLERRVSSGQVTVADGDEAAELYETAAQMLAGAGYHRYEVSNFALPGRECGHNLGYWHGGMYVGLGPAAHSHMPTSGGQAPAWVRSWNISDIRDYVHRVMAGERPEYGREVLDAEAEARDRVMLGLRTSNGVDLGLVDAEYGVNLTTALMPAMRARQAQGLVEIEGTRIRIPPPAVLLANLVLADAISLP